MNIIATIHGLPWTNAEFATAFGHNLALLPVREMFTATEIRNMIAPQYSVQKITAYLRMAVAHGIVCRTEAHTKHDFVDALGNRHPTAYYYVI